MDQRSDWKFIAITRQKQRSLSSLPRADGCDRGNDRPARKSQSDAGAAGLRSSDNTSSLTQQHTDFCENVLDTRVRESGGEATAAQRYPAKVLPPALPLARATVCANSNQLATNECLAAGAGYELTLPADKVPTMACQIHGGLQTQLAQRMDDAGQRAEALPNRVFQSFRKFFGRK